MRYVDAGYAIALTVLALYSLTLVVRRRRLERAARLGDAGHVADLEGTAPTGLVPADAPTGAGGTADAPFARDARVTP